MINVGHRVLCGMFAGAGLFALLMASSGAIAAGEFTAASEGNKTTLRPLPAYYAIYAWGRFAKCTRAVKVRSDTPDIFVAAARGDGGKRALFLARYADDENFAYARNVTIRPTSGKFPKEISLHVTDEDRRHTEMIIAPDSEDTLKLMMEPYSFVLIEYDELPISIEISRCD